MLSKTHRAFIIPGILIVGIAGVRSANAAPPDDACSLLSPAQVGAALGVPVDAGAYVAPAFKGTCTWKATTNGGGVVTLKLATLGEYEGGKRLAAYGAAAGEQASTSATPLSGIGDEAYYLKTGTLVSLIVKKGNAAFKVAVYARVPLEKQQSVEKTLAQQVVSRL